MDTLDRQIADRMLQLILEEKNFADYDTIWYYLRNEFGYEEDADRVWLWLIRDGIIEQDGRIVRIVPDELKNARGGIKKIMRWRNVWGKI